MMPEGREAEVTPSSLPSTPADAGIDVPRIAVLGPVAGQVAFVMELTLVPLILPSIQSKFGLSIGELAWVFNSYSIAIALGVLLGGGLGDAFDTRKVFGCGLAIFLAGSLLVATAQTFETVVIGRALQGFGGGIFTPLVPLLLTRVTPQSPGRVLILWGSISGYVAAFSPLLYGSLFGSDNWHFAFVFIAFAATFALVVASRTRVANFPRPPSHAKGNYLRLFGTRGLWLVYAYVFLTYGAITYYLFRLPVRLSNLDVNVVSLGFVLSIMWLTFSGLSTLLRNVVDKPHLRTVMLSAPVLIAAGVSLLYESENIWLLVVSAVLVGSGLACSNAPSTQLVLSLAPKGMSALSTSLDITFARLGGIAMITIFAEMTAEFAIPSICICCLLAGFCALTARREPAAAV